MIKTPWILYHTDGCHLCDEAQKLLDASPCVYLCCDIFDDPQLLKRYSTTIPVLKCTQTGHELSWPFCSHQLALFLESNL